MNQSEKILELLEKSGEAGANNYELNKIAFRYSARISELRKQGYDIQTKQLTKNKFLYILVDEEKDDA